MYCFSNPILPTCINCDIAHEYLWNFVSDYYCSNYSLPHHSPVKKKLHETSCAVGQFTRID